jgi:hypothetical protein
VSPKPYRSYQVCTPYWFCTRCAAGSSGQDAEDQGGAHRDASGHEVHVVSKAVVILRPVQEAEAAL